MEIIKHGKTYEVPQEKVCPDCKCEFSFVKEDIKRLWGGINELIYTYINCPECSKTIIIKHF